MTGTVLFDGKRSAVAAPPREAPHDLHGLVAIANGPDYCLCGRTWPCEKRAA